MFKYRLPYYYEFLCSSVHNTSLKTIRTKIMGSVIVADTFGIARGYKSVLCSSSHLTTQKASL